MEYTKLGNTGMDVSRICLGFFETANVYSPGTSEESLGRALKGFANRDEVVIATQGATKAPPRCTAKCTTDRMAPGSRARRS